MLQEIWNIHSGINGFYPEHFMSDDSSAQINALRATFPQSQILLCQFHVLQALWKWLQSNSLSSKRQRLIRTFRKIMYSKNNFNSLKQEFINSIEDEKTLKHFEKVYKNEKLFATAFRKEKTLYSVTTFTL